MAFQWNEWCQLHQHSVRRLHGRDVDSGSGLGRFTGRTCLIRLMSPPSLSERTWLAAGPLSVFESFRADHHSCGWPSLYKTTEWVCSPEQQPLNFDSEHFGTMISLLRNAVGSVWRFIYLAVAMGSALPIEETSPLKTQGWNQGIK